MEGGGWGIIFAFFSLLSWIMLPWARSVKPDHRHIIHYTYLPILFYSTFQNHHLSFIIYKIELKFLVIRASERIKGMVQEHVFPSIETHNCFHMSFILYFLFPLLPMNQVLLAVETTWLMVHSSGCEAAFSLALNVGWPLCFRFWVWVIVCVYNIYV